LRILVTFTLLTSLLLVGCQSTYSPKLSKSEKWQKKMMLSGVPKTEFTQYIDILFVKSCVDMHRYMKPRGLTVVSAKDNKMVIRLPSGQTSEVFVNNLQCSEESAI